MKVSKLKSFICLILVIVMMAAFVGCNSGNSKVKTNSNGSTQDTEKLGYPITKDPISLRYWLPFGAAASKYIRSYAENEVYMEMEKVTGIKVEYIHPTVSQEGEQFNLMIASGDIPDMIQTAGRYKGGVSQGVDDGVYLDLTSYVEKYAPDYYKLLNSDPLIKKQATSENGRVEALYTILSKSAQTNVPSRRLITRRDWLNESGMKEPKTFADWEAYLKFIKDSKGIQIPFVFTANGMEAQFMGAFNIMQGFFLKDGKTVDFGQIQPQYKDYLALMNKWYQFGYISKDFPTVKQGKAKFIGGQTGVIIDAIAATYAEAKAAGIEVVSNPYPRINAGDKLHWDGPAWPVGGYESAVSKDSKYKTEAIRWLNYAFSDEGSMLFNYGIKDKSYVIKDGKPVFTDYMLNNPQIPVESSGGIFRVHFGTKLGFSEFECNPGVLASGEESINIRKKWSDDKDIDGQIVLPPIKLTADESNNRAQLMTDINSYVNEMTLKFITGAEPLNRFDEYVNSVKKLNISEAIQITQKAYDRYIK